jgi:HK97 gp10 family phage protein
MLKLYIDKVIKDLERSENNKLIAAAKHVAEKLKENVKKQWKQHTRNLQKGVGYKKLPHAVLVGYGPPASHAHLLEMGTQHRVVKNYMGHKGWEVSAGKITPHPVIFPTFEQETPEVERILSEPW